MIVPRWVGNTFSLGIQDLLWYKHTHKKLAINDIGHSTFTEENMLKIFFRVEKMTIWPREIPNSSSFLSKINILIWIFKG